jgi:hypothetical protein
MAKQSQAWKAHERETAKYFKTARRLRGSDFSVSDVEVLVDVNSWLYEIEKTSGPHMVVECKYSSKAGIVTDFKEMTKGCQQTPLVVRGKYLLMLLNDFKQFYINFIDGDISGLDALLSYEFLHSSKKAPQYIEDYRDQSLDYTKDTQGPCLPIVSLAKNGVKGKIAIINLDDMASYKLELENHAQYENI